MAEDFEIQHTENNESGEVTAEAVEKLAKQLQGNGGHFAQREEKVRQMNRNAAHIMVKMLKSPGKGTLAKLMAKAIHEGNPPALVLGVASLYCHEINPEMRREDMLIFEKNSWPSEHRERLEDWERIVVASLEHCVDEFRKLVEEKNSLPDLAKLIKYVIEKSCHLENVNGEMLVNGLANLVK